jgi:hypothetical protein
MYTDDNIRVLVSSLIAAIISLVGVALGGWIGYRSAKSLADRNGRRLAASDLRAAFAPELAIVRNTPRHTWKSLERILGDPNADLTVILRAAFDRHAIAIEKYRFFVPVSDRPAYDVAWREYYMEDGTIGFARYMYGDTGQPDFFRHVDAIFRFTDL